MPFPTIGRVVLVYRRESKGDQYEPALITYVHDEQTINVGGFTENGVPFALTRIPLYHDSQNEAIHHTHGPGQVNSYACWMPYQRQQDKPR